jgi:type II secretory pathway pseudopilin PulG
MTKNTFPSNYKRSNHIITAKGEEGMTMVIALLMGTVLLAGSSGLMMRQIMARKLGASESYQQMAESAALNGLNRIISDINRDDRENYTGFLLALNNSKNQWGWATPNSENFELVELCTPVTKYTKAYPAQTESEAPNMLISDGNMRNDGGNNDIQVAYRLRSYNTTASSGNGEGTFYIEGIVKRGETVMARALLRRSLYVSSKVAGAGDWSVMSGHNLRLNDTEINGPGNIFYLTNTPTNYLAPQYSTGCSDASLLADVSASNTALAGKNLNNQVWPININVEERGVSGMPPSTLFEKDPVNDTTTGSGGNTIRMWSFDDSAPAPGDRDGDGLNDLQADGITPILYPALPCAEAVCVRDADQTDTGDYGISNSGDFRTLSEEGININPEESIITLKPDILCKQSNQFDCHVYLDHINLGRKKLHIETSDNRSVVLHLEQPVAYPNDGRITRAIKLSDSAEICSVNPGSTTCNGNPEQLVIMASSGTAPIDSCNTRVRSVSFTGANLPYAILYLPTGTIRPNNATLSGLAWASSICVVDANENPSSFTLNTDQSGVPIVQRANDNWGWLSRFNYPGYGRMVTRAIRGTSLDTFERW